MHEETRTPLKKGDRIQIGEAEFSIESQVGEGTSCLAYRAFRVDPQSGLQNMPVIVKEFYPMSSTHLFDIRRVGQELKVSALTKDDSEYKKRLSQFGQGYKCQWNLSCSDETMELMVRPQMQGMFGDSYYAVTEIHAGLSMDQVVFSTLKEKLEVVMAVADTLQLLHSAGYLLLDFKPENLLWIPQTKRVKLFDADSVLDYRHLEDVEPEDIRFNMTYISPELRLFHEIVENDHGEFQRKKQIYLTPSTDIYSAGLLLCYQLFGRIPENEEEIETESFKDELCKCYRDELNGREKFAGALAKIIRRALRGLVGYRYQTAQSLFSDLAKVYHALTAETYVPRKIVAKANYSYVAYNLLEKYPLFDYSSWKAETRVLDVAIVGAHGMRRQMIQAMIACGQMLDTRLNIRLFDAEAEHFWETFTSEDTCPELNRVVTCNLNHKIIRMDVDKTIADSPLAHIYLDTNDSDSHIIDIMRACHTKYFVLIQEEEGRNTRLAKTLAKEAGSEPVFIGYLNNEGKKITVYNENVKTFVLSSQKMSEAYCEEAFESKIYQMGLAVHMYYSGGNEPGADLEKIREAFRNDPYNIASSERSALHGVYKLASIGIDWYAEDAKEQFYNRVLKRETEEQRALFDRLAHLEHRSWTAHMVLQGTRSVGTAEELRNYAYVGNNDWKDRSDPEHIKHPCLCASRPGRVLPECGWEKLTEDQIGHLDPLDNWSYLIWQELENLVEKEQAVRAHKIQEIQCMIEKEGWCELSFAYNRMEEALNGCLKKVPSARKLWKNARKDFGAEYHAKQKKNPRLEEVLADLDRLMRPVLQNSEYHDFKKPDEDVLFAIAEILEARRKNESADENAVRTVSGEFINRDGSVMENGGTFETEVIIRKDLSLQIKAVLKHGQKTERLEGLFAMFDSEAEKPLFHGLKQRDRGDGTVEVTFSMSSPALREALQKFKEE